MAPTTLQAEASQQSASPGKVALLGWSDEAIAGLRKAGHEFVAVVLPDFAKIAEDHGIPYETCDFALIDEQGHDLAVRLAERGVAAAVPLYEETVPWAGAINGHIWGDPRQLRRCLLFRDKAMMKRMAQIHGLRVGLFEEVEDKEGVRRFLRRVRDALVETDDDDHFPVHLKPLDAAGAVGHRVLREMSDVDAIQDDEFPCIVESHLEGREFSCEAFIHDKKVRFLNITEYIKLGHTNFIPASPDLERFRPQIMEAVEKLVDASGIHYGMIHPEFFITEDGAIRFGEVAARVPGGHIFELMSRAYGFDPFVAKALCWNPDTPEDVLEAFFPEPVTGAQKFAGCVMVHPGGKNIEKLSIPSELEDEEYFVGHTLAEPLPGKVPEREGFGNHYGTLFFEGDDPDRMRELLKHYDQQEYFA